MANSVTVLKPSDIRDLRNRLGDKRRKFGKRFCRSDRTVEAWEVGRRSPDKLCLRIMRELVIQLNEPCHTVAHRT
mgnify:CR=1 FL=1